MLYPLPLLLIPSPSTTIQSPASIVVSKVPLTEISVLSLLATISTFSHWFPVAVPPFPLTKIYSLPTLSEPTIWSIPKSLPEVPSAKLPVPEPELTTIALSEVIRVPIKSFGVPPSSEATAIK